MWNHWFGAQGGQKGWSTLYFFGLKKINFLIKIAEINNHSGYEPLSTLKCSWIHSRPQSLRSFWPVAGIESSGSNHFEITKEITKFCPSGLTQPSSMTHPRNGCSQSSWFLPQARRIVGSGDENVLDLKWKGLCVRRRIHRLIYVFKCLNGLLDHNYNFTTNSSVYNYQTRHANDLRINRSRCGKGQLCSSYFI